MADAAGGVGHGLRRDLEGGRAELATDFLVACGMGQWSPGNQELIDYIRDTGDGRR